MNRAADDMGVISSEKAMSEDTSASLDTILNQTTDVVDLNPSEPEETGSTEQPEAKAEGNPEAQAKPEPGDKPAQDGTPPPEGADKDKPAENDPQEAFKKAAIDERRKRQAFEQEIAAMRQEIHRLKQGEQRPPDLYEDPEGFQAYQQSQVNNQITGMKLQLSEVMVRESVGDEAFEAAMEFFKDEVQTNPGIINELNNSPNPAKFAYNMGLQARKRAEIGDPDQFAARITQETEKRMLAEMDKIVSERVQAALSERLPKSLAGVQSSGDRNQAPVDEGHVPLSAILGEK